MFRLPALALLLAIGGCTSAMRMPGPPRVVGRPPPPRPELPASPQPEPTIPAPAAPREVAPATGIAAAARHYLDHTPRGYRADCSGFVCAAANRAGFPLEGNTEGLWTLAQAHGATHRREPRPGDLAFFDQTYDRNRNGKLDDELTHVAVVLEVDRDGTVVLAHGGTGVGRTTIRMNLDHPDDRHDAEGAEINGYLRPQRASDPKRTAYLAGQLWRGYATVDPSWFEPQLSPVH